MPFQLSAGVNVSEIDLTTVVPAVSTTAAGFAGRFVWGPVLEVGLVSSETELVARHGKPDANTYISFFSAANFLGYGNNLKPVRVIAYDCVNAVANTGTGTLIKTRDDYVTKYANLTAKKFVAKYPGALGNSLKISLADANSTSWAYASSFQSTPGTSSYATQRSGSNDEIHMVVIDEDGAWTGTANTVLEKFAYASKAQDAKNPDGSSNYYVDVLNRSSKYVWWTNHEAPNWGSSAAGVAFTTLVAAGVSYSFSGGLDGGVPSAANVVTGFAKFTNPDEIDVSLLISGEPDVTVGQSLVDLCETRKDCIAFLSPAFADAVNNAGSETTDVADYFRNGSTGINKSSSYAVYDSGWKYQYDVYNDVYRWIPLNSDIAGLCARTDETRDAWFSPAGFNRGQIRGVVKLGWNPTKSNRDELYRQGINPVVSFPGEGTVLYGDKTGLAKPSAFDRINVRRLFIVLEKAIARASKFSLFEFNDQFTRAQFVSLVEPFLREVQGRRGIYDFKVVCDDTNNTAEVVDRNEFIGDIYIKPARSINFIQLNFVAVRTGVNFSEIIGSF